MAVQLEEALGVARQKYPHTINHYEEYEKYFVFEHDDGEEHVGGTLSPIVVRKSDMATFNYESIFFDFSDDAEDVGDVLSEGIIS